MSINDFSESVERYADNVLNGCRDRYGTEHTGLLADFFNSSTREPGRWEETLESRSGTKKGPIRIPSNLAIQQGFLRTLQALAALKGEQHYRKAAEEWVGCALPLLQDPTSGLLYWGGHSTFDLKKTEPVIGCHEMKCVYPDYSIFYEVDADRTRFLIEAIWERHVHDWSRLLFNRHGAYGGSRLKAGTGGFWQHYRFDGGSVPFVENEYLTFINTGSDLIYAGAMLGSLSGEAAPLEWAQLLLDRYDRIRHPDTGLGGYQFNYLEPCRVRASFKPPLNRDEAINETMVLDCGVIRRRYGAVALTLLNLAEEIGKEKGGEFLRFVHRDLSALARHAYDFSTHCFLPCFNDGRRITPDDCVERAGYLNMVNLTPLPPTGLMFLTFAKGYRLTGDPALKDVALDQARGLGWAVERNGGGYSVDVEALHSIRESAEEIHDVYRRKNEEDTAILMGWLELARADGRRELVEVAAGWGETLMERYFRNGFFYDSVSGTHESTHTGIDTGRFARTGNSLPLALLHLASELEERTEGLPPYYPSLSDFTGLKNYHPDTGWPGQP